MAKNEQQRQKKLAKKRSKEIAKRRQVAREKNRLSSFDGQWELACNGSLDRCYIADDLLDHGSRFGSIVISRRMADGRVAVARFLVDGLCLGVKDTRLLFASRSEFTDMIQYSPGTMEIAIPAAAKKFIQSAVQFARSVGFEPHRHFAKAFELLHDVDASQCKTEFTFGRDGKPLFITGPYDTPESIGRILSTLNETVGESNYVIEYDGSQEIEEWDDEGSWADDPELDADIDADVIDAIESVPKQ